MVMTRGLEAVCGFIAGFVGISKHEAQTAQINFKKFQMDHDLFPIRKHRVSIKNDFLNYVIHLSRKRAGGLCLKN